jgi:hypothetical protein
MDLAHATRWPRFRHKRHEDTDAPSAYHAVEDDGPLVRPSESSLQGVMCGGHFIAALIPSGSAAIRPFPKRPLPRRSRPVVNAPT